MILHPFLCLIDHLIPCNHMVVLLEEATWNILDLSDSLILILPELFLLSLKRRQFYSPPVFFLLVMYLMDLVNQY